MKIVAVERFDTHYSITTQLDNGMMHVQAIPVLAFEWRLAEYGFRDSGELIRLMVHEPYIQADPDKHLYSTDTETAKVHLMEQAGELKSNGHLDRLLSTLDPDRGRIRVMKDHVNKTRDSQAAKVADTAASSPTAEELARHLGAVDSESPGQPTQGQVPRTANVRT